ncbi:MAG: sulfotransferase family 2 domain-containing protein [Luminiphilus sp.]|nr:sulfotransferase family 2 domain-containing protein [Luminiphilus sp.]
MTVDNHPQTPRQLTSSAKLSASKAINSFQLAYARSRWKRHNLYCKHTQLLFGFTPKAGCSTVAKLFFYNTPGHESTDFITWPHKYRQEYKKLSPVRLTCWMAQGPLKIKFVRDPYTRAVSSYTHVMRRSLMHSISGSLSKEASQFSFSDFLNWLTTIRLDFANPHFGLQRIPLESKLFRFDHVIKTEALQERISYINQRHQLELKVPDELFSSRHHLDRSSAGSSFCGDTPFGELGITAEGKNAPPYAAFYNSDLAQKVSTLYKDDIDLYDYRDSLDQILD